MPAAHTAPRRPPDAPKQPSGAHVSKNQGKSFLSSLPPGLRIPLVAGATVVGLALLTFVFFLLNGPDKPASATPGAQAEAPGKRSVKCSVEGFLLDLRNCR
jgi:hypothetical protein